MEFIRFLGEEATTGLLFTIVGGVILIAVVGLVQWRKVRQAELTAALTQEMLQRCLSAEEIASVLRSQAGRRYRGPSRADVPDSETADRCGGLRA